MAKWRRKPTKEMIARSTKLLDQMVKEGVKIIGWCWTLSRYDSVLIAEEKDEKTVMKALLHLEKWSQGKPLSRLRGKKPFNSSSSHRTTSM